MKASRTRGDEHDNVWILCPTCGGCLENLSFRDTPINKTSKSDEHDNVMNMCATCGVSRKLKFSRHPQ